MNEIEKYYNKFNEDKRLLTRHGKVEFAVTIHHIKKIIRKGDRVIDIGAGTGRYSNALMQLGCEVTAVELVKKNLSVLKQNFPTINAMQGNALNLKKIKDNSYDVALLLGPLYHLFTLEDKITALTEAKRIVKPGGYIFVQYLLADYAIIRHGFMDNLIAESFKNNKLDNNFNILCEEKDLYSYVRLKDINQLNKKAGLKRKYIFAPDGATDYIRQYINKLNEQDFNKYIEYQIFSSTKKELVGASSHVVDVLIKL